MLHWNSYHQSSTVGQIDFLCFYTGDNNHTIMSQCSVFHLLSDHFISSVLNHLPTPFSHLRPLAFLSVPQRHAPCISEPLPALLPAWNFSQALTLLPSDFSQMSLCLGNCNSPTTRTRLGVSI